MFFVFYTILSPIAGYLGDRWKRKRIMQIATRCFVGIGEASYSTLAPTILSDLFMGNARTKVLGLFYFAAPVGSIPIVVGASTCLAGIFGVLSGAKLGRYLRRWVPAADAYVCSASLFICAPFLFFALVSPSWNFYVCIGVVIPTRRSTASALQMVMSHALGDAISPAIVGRIAVAFTDLHSLETQYLGLQRALFLTAFVCALGGFLFLMVTLYLVKAKNDVHRAIQASQHDMVAVISGQEIEVPATPSSIHSEVST
ncbi:uncharacterized protein DC041_0003615 [Schistosoma bovis]|uniref:Major facilitator superfamily (MFS) profile domain-containing protein n=1 Tax=Schistosoma bovis TaxID=6184 RepID=A0A430QP10_SCHBO|nr:uncharacterized protein DC041_0003615 [Schistosoma bovis]